VAHACNPSYSGGRDREDQGSKPAQTSSLRDPILKHPITRDWWSDSGSRVPASKYEALSSNSNTIKKKKSSQKRAGGVAQGVGPEVKPQY
jgi:hypothetical protein